jgi:hypothetical protein
VTTEGPANRETALIEDLGKMVRRLTVFGLAVGAKKKHGLPER